MSKKKSLLFVTTELPWPADSGGRIKSFRLIQFLSTYYELNLVCAHGARDSKTLTSFREHSGAQSVQVFDSFRKRTAFNWFMALMQFPTFNSFRVYSKRLESMLKWGIERSDIVIIDHLEMFEMIDSKSVSKAIYHSHNAEFKLWGDYAKLEGNPLKKWLLEWESDRVKLFERWVIQRARMTFMAPNDSNLLMSELNLNKDKFKLTFHLGNDVILQTQLVDIANSKKQIFFAGTLSWMPNCDGIEWFVTECWPLILKSHQDANLVVCGKGANTKLEAKLKNTHGLSYLGYVDDLEPIMNSSRCAIVPLRFGSGMKIKTFDAMYRGLPVVTTRIGAEGIDVENEKHLLIANDSNLFAQQVVRLLSNDEESRTLASNARKLMNDRYTYDRIFGHMLNDIEASKEIQS